MNIKNNDEFRYWAMSYSNPDLVSWLKQYPAKENENAFAKGIPNTPENNEKINEIAKIIPLRRRYRGHSKTFYRRPRDFVHKQFADTIALYEKITF